ncbi:MAG: NlpC/P60 family protein [Paracoccus sp. (in: a-proteobacteria)]|nr:NlpC/P60 family protein [Paracoccus sp. (in: a-proteobacteria)]
MSERVIAAARAWIGTPYAHQASCRGAGADCLGLLRGVWREVHGAEPWRLPAYTPDWGEDDDALERALRRWLWPSAGEAPGQVVLFRMREGRAAKHLGLISGAATFIHAQERHGVVEVPLSLPWRRRIAARFRFPD